MKEEEASNTKEGAAEAAQTSPWAGPAAGYTQKEQEVSEIIPGVQKTPPESELSNLQLDNPGPRKNLECVWLSGYLFT